MQNGTGLLGNFSSTQSSIIVPDPAFPNRYFYLFTISSGFCCGGAISDGLRYSKIDMCLDGGLGGVMTSFKNIQLVDSVAEKIAVTRHANGVDYWILIHRYFSDQFWAYPLTSSGLGNPVITAVGSNHNAAISGSQGQMKFSPNGQRIAVGASNALQILDVFNFDASTGIVSNAMSLTKPNNNSAVIYGVEFSPDNTKLYASGMNNSGPVYPFLIQYDLSAGGGTLAAIHASLATIYLNTGATQMAGKGLQLAPDNKIYWVSVNSSNPNGTLAVINNPNAAGTACNYLDQAVSLAGMTGSFCVPSFIAGYDYSNKTTTCESPTALANELLHEVVSLYPNPSTEGVHLRMISKTIQQATVSIRNSLGALLWQETLAMNTGLNEKTLPTADFPSGVYIITVDGTDGVTHVLRWVCIHG